jgi:hypothetical protein
MRLKFPFPVSKFPPEKLFGFATPTTSLRNLKENEKKSTKINFAWLVATKVKNSFDFPVTHQQPKRFQND